MAGSIEARRAAEALHSWWPAATEPFQSARRVCSASVEAWLGRGDWRDWGLEREGATRVRSVYYRVAASTSIWQVSAKVWKAAVRHCVAPPFRSASGIIGCLRRREVEHIAGSAPSRVTRPRVRCLWKRFARVRSTVAALGMAPGWRILAWSIAIAWRTCATGHWIMAMARVGRLTRLLAAVTVDRGATATVAGP